MIQRRRVWLAMVVVAALFRGLFWLLTGPVFNPIDEAQHFGFVSAISRGHGIPNVHDSLPREVLELAKASPALPFHSTPVTPDDPDDPRWGVFAKQYEAMQGPAYYALMVPAYWLGRPFGALGSLYAVRAASLALVLLAIPLTYCLTVQLSSGRHRIALGATVILVAIQSFTANAATVTNDALVAPLTLAVLLAGLAFFEKPSTRRALILGTMVGVGFLTKGTFLFVVILLALLAVLPPHRKRLSGGRPRSGGHCEHRCASPRRSLAVLEPPRVRCAHRGRRGGADAEAAATEPALRTGCRSCPPRRHA